MIYRHTPDMGEISGFGGPYEEQCQTMLAAGARYIATANRKLNLTFDTNENVFGIIIPNSQDAEDLYNVVLHSVERNCTGAMMHAVIQRLQYINNKGWDDYCRELREHPDEEEHDPIDDPDFHDDDEEVD